MKRNSKLIWLACLALALPACSGTNADNCWEYAAEIDELIENGTPEELSAHIEATEEHVARLMMDDPDRAQPCVEAVLEAVFVAEFADFEMLFEE